MQQKWLCFKNKKDNKSKNNKQRAPPHLEPSKNTNKQKKGLGEVPQPLAKPCKIFKGKRASFRSGKNGKFGPSKTQKNTTSIAFIRSERKPGF